MIGFIIRQGLRVWNDPNSKPTFQSVNGESWIDVTMSKPPLFHTAAHTWRVEESTLSDHGYITFSIGPSDTNVRPTKYSHNKYRLQRMAKAFQKQSDDLSNKLMAVNNGPELDEVVENITSEIQKQCERFLVKKNDMEKGKKGVWWTASLETQRKRTRAIRRRYKNADSPQTNLSGKWNTARAGQSTGRIS